MTTNEQDDMASDDRLERHEEEAAAAEAGAIGGDSPEYEGGEEQRAVQEGGGGVAEGFEESERELIEAASHGEHRHSPADDEFTPELEADRTGAVYGEPDEADPAEGVGDRDGNEAEEPR